MKNGDAMCPDNDYVLETDNVSYKYDKNGRKALNEISIKIKKGVRTAILGANGAGKPTLFSVLNALYKPQEGKVLYMGEPVSYRHKSIIRMRSEVSILFQDPDSMLFRPYVEDDVAYGPENMGLPKSEVEQRVDEALFAVGMQKYRKSSVMKLSYGQRKRVTIAGVLAMRPKVLILDEPTAGLDPQMACEVMELTEELHRSGTTVIMASHDTDLTYSWADEIHVLRMGRCVYSGKPEPFYSDKPSVYLSGLLPPKVFLMNEGLCQMRSVSSEPYPKTRAQLISKTAMPHDDLGKMYVLPVEGGSDADAVMEALSKSGLSSVARGIYGTSARKAKDIADVGITYYYDGPENCIRNCMNGNDSVLLCDPTMIDTAVSGVDFVDRSGFGKIDVKVLPPSGPGQTVTDVPDDKKE